jgi:2-keto-4-pentenoate hydratase/2-oxohepta-3-ene-1,7-dioic acid hydratase in catechol pathway
VRAAGSAAGHPIEARREEPPMSALQQPGLVMPSKQILLSIAHPDGQESLGAKTAAGVLDVSRAAEILAMPAPSSVDQMLQEGRGAELNRLLAAAENAPQAAAARVDEAAVSYGLLFRHPGRILCVGLNYRRHAEEIGANPPRVPPLFSKFDNALAAHGASIRLPPAEITSKVDYETELVVVMGAAARDVPADKALDYVAGYCIGNDLSARDLQLELPSGQWLIGKTLDGFAPVGPYFVSADLVGDPNRLSIETRVNGELRQSSTTADFVFNVQQVIAYISRHWTLEPGDLIFTGTPHGVILGQPPEKRVWLKPGDEIVSAVEKLGELKFRLA